MMVENESRRVAEEPTPGMGEGGAAADRRSALRPMVSLDRISKTFTGGNQAVKEVSLEIQEGEIFTLLGPSGCGKTTTLRLVAGLEEPDGGSIYFRDQPIVDMKRGTFVRPNKRSVGMVFQSYALWPHMTVAENIAYPLELRGVKRTEVKNRVTRVLELVGLEGLEEQPAPLLSGGQQQRVALARALVYEPTILLLDEPFSNLDAKLRDQMRVELKLLQSRLKITVLFVTHDQVEGLSLSDRIAVMNLGQVQQVGRPEEMYERPANPFVRDFIGKTVLLRGMVRVSNPDGQVAVSVEGAPDCVLFGRSYHPEETVTGRRVYLAMRPEDTELSKSEGSQIPTGTIAGRVETRLFVGERTEYRVKVHEQGAVLVYGKRHQLFQEGQEVWLKPHPQSISVWVA